MSKHDKSGVERAGAAAARFAEDAREQAEEAFETAVDAAQDGLDEAHRFMRRQWRERPLAVAATALGVGVVLGMLLNSGRRG